MPRLDDMEQKPPVFDVTERRQHQRFIARRGGRYCFWAEIDGQRYPLLDLSMHGFAVAPQNLPAVGETLTFTLFREGVPDKISGQAEVRNHVGQGEKRQAGCRFLTLSDDESTRLMEWLTAHVLMTTSVPISEKDAEKIVSGPPLI